MTIVFGIIGSIIAFYQATYWFAARGLTAPTALSCEEFLKDPTAARWVTLSGCRLEREASVVSLLRKKGKQDLGDIYIPVGAKGAPEGQTRAVLKLEPSTFSLQTDLDRLLDAAGGPVEPELITAYRQPLDSSPKSFPDALVITEGLSPDRSYNEWVAGLGALLIVVAAVLHLGSGWLRRREGLA